MNKQSTSGVSSTLLLSIPVLAYLSTRHVLLYPSSWEEWLLVDYLGRLLVLAYVCCVPSVRSHVVWMFTRPWQDFGSAHRALLLLLVVIIAVVYEAMVGLAKTSVYQQYPDTAVFKYFEIDSPLWLYVDLALGLMLVAISEEILFRGCLFEIFGRYTQSTVVVVALSAIVFGVVHWPTGIDNIFATAMTGVLLGAVYAWSKSLVPCVIIHYFNNLIHFWPN